MGQKTRAGEKIPGGFQGITPSLAIADYFRFDMAAYICKYVLKLQEKNTEHMTSDSLIVATAMGIILDLLNIIVLCYFSGNNKLSTVMADV